MNQVKITFGTILGGLSVLMMAAGGICQPAQAQHAPAHARITAAQAQAVALKKYPGRVEGKINLENEEGSWQYAVNVRSGKTLREVMVNATTGKIASVEVTTKAEEAREQKAEKMAKARAAAHSHHANTGAHTGRH